MFQPFHFMTSNGASWICSMDLLPDGDLGECDPNTHLITISPRGSGQQLLDTLIHEFLHAEMPDWRHDMINLTAGTLSVHLYAMGYRAIGKGKPDADRVGKVLADMINQVCRKMEGHSIRAMASSMATYLSLAGYRRMRRGAKHERGADSGFGGPGPSERKAGAGRSGRSKRGKKIGFGTSEGPPSPPPPGGVDNLGIG